MSTVMVTGGAGFIGSNFIRYWLGKYLDDRIVNYDLLTYAGYLPSLDDVVERHGDRYTFVKGDIGDYDLALATMKEHEPDFVVNFAAESHNSRAILHPEAFFQTNCVGVVQLMKAARDTEVWRFHHISTCEVYGDLALDTDEVFTEESPFEPKTPYNASKAAGDMAVETFHLTFGLPVTISNCSNNYGPYQFPEKVIPRFCTLALQGEKMTLYKTSQNKREWLHVDDHCRAIDLILKQGKVGEMYNVGSGLEVDVEGIADGILGVLGLDDSYKNYVPDRPSHDRRYLLDSNKIRNELGWSPEVDYGEGFAATVNWYKENEAWWQPLLSRAAEVDEGKWG
ncbi:TPA: dTDP-glucose 4,6-dehydratase [Candidatus Latescibacteria bacterium]|nr:dTDP-glucose 4,6-dehydratase [Candidatus Latescibacterota bacterium]